ncbi:MAG: Hsp20/alpha crystallin family protein [Nitrospirota bacterium]
MKRKESKEIATKEPLRVLAPFEEAERWFEEVFRHPFGLFGRRRWPVFRHGELEEISTSVDIFEDDSNVVVKAELPGMKKEDIDVTVTDHTMKISGEKKREEKVEKKDYYWEERSYGSFARSFQLPSEVQTDKAEAKFKDGILEIRIPKTEEARQKEKKVSVQ